MRHDPVGKARLSQHSEQHRKPCPVVGNQEETPERMETSRILKRRWAWLAHASAGTQVTRPGFFRFRRDSLRSGPVRTQLPARPGPGSRYVPGGKPGWADARGHVAAAGSSRGAALASAAVRSGGPRSLRRLPLPPHPRCGASLAPGRLRQPLPLP